MKSVMSLEMYEKLKLKNLDSTSIPHVVGASGESLGARGKTKCEININGKIFYQTFIVCEHLKRPIILGRDFSIQNCIGISWTKTNTRRLTQNNEVIAETAEYQTPSRASVSLKRNIKVPPRSCAVVDVDINTTEKIKVEVTPDQLWLSANPNICTYPMIADLKEREPNTVTPFVIVNFSHHEHLHLPRDHVVAFAEKDCKEGEVLEICTMEQLEKELPRNWIPERKRQEKFSEFFENPFMQKDDDFLKSPAEAPVHRKVLLEDKDISPKTQKAFDKLCEKYDDIISKNSGDIGKTMLVEMEIDTGNHPPIASKPYTLPLKHYDWVQKEIETLERAGIIERSISPWASPVVIVPKKSAPGEPPRRRMCVDYRKINKLQPEVTKADGGKGCISLIPLPKIDELYAKLKGYKVFSSLDLRSGYYHIGLKDSAKPKSAFVLSSLGKYQFNRVPFGLAQAPAYFQKLINDILKGCNFAMGYLDDIIIYSRSEKEHLEHLEEIFTRLKTAGLKLKLEKCCFFKKHIQYLGHLISADGIQPLPEKLESIAKMPAPKNPKEVKQFLGLVGYYRKFVPRFADISRVLTHLTKKDVEFKWTPECEKCFQILKEFLQQAPILRYPDPQASYTLYTDASKYAYAGVLTQHNNGTDHPITYVSGLFRGSQLNWATLTKEAYAIYMSVKKLSFYIDTAKITVKSDHLPLKKFLEKNTLNSKVNNWAVELESQNITFEYIPGIRNTLADTLSRLIEMDENIKLQPEEEGKEFGYFPFEELPPVTTQVVEEVIKCEIGNINIQHTDPIEINTDIHLPLKDDKLAKLQESDPHTKQLRKQWENKNLDQNTYTMENNILKRKLVDNGLLYTPIVVPDVLKDCLLILAHDKQGHNGFRRTYASLKNRYHWKGMKKSVYQHCTNCQVCAKHNIKTQQLKNEHFSSPPQPMEFIAMDLIGEFHPASSKGNRFALTAVCMLTGFTFCIPLKSKRAEDVIKAYIDHICCIFGPSRKILTDNGTEFKNKLWTEVFEKLRTEQKFTPIYSPQCNGRIEGFHKFLKATIAKQLETRVEWDDLVWKATAAYNFFPTESSGLAPFFLMFGREAAVKHTLLESENPKYLGTNEGMINVGLMTKLYNVVAHNLNEARKARDGKKKRTTSKEPETLKIGDNILVRDHTSKAFQPKYKDFCIVGLLGKNQVEIKDNHGHITKVHRRDVKKIPMTEKVCKLYEEEQAGKTREGRKAVPNSKMPDLGWDIAETQLTLEAQKENNSNMTPLLQTLVTVIVLIIAIVKQTTAGIKKVTKKAAQVIEASHNRIIKNIKDFHRNVTSAITIATNTTDRTNHKEQARINNKTTKYFPGTRKPNDEYDESYQSITSRTYNHCDN